MVESCFGKKSVTLFVLLLLMLLPLNVSSWAGHAAPSFTREQKNILTKLQKSIKSFPVEIYQKNNSGEAGKILILVGVPGELTARDSLFYIPKLFNRFAAIGLYTDKMKPSVAKVILEEAIYLQESIYAQQGEATDSCIEDKFQLLNQGENEIPSGSELIQGSKPALIRNALLGASVLGVTGGVCYSLFDIESWTNNALDKVGSPLSKQVGCCLLAIGASCLAKYVEPSGDEEFETDTKARDEISKELFEKVQNVMTAVKSNQFLVLNDLKTSRRLSKIFNETAGYQKLTFEDLTVEPAHDSPSPSLSTNTRRVSKNPRKVQFSLLRKK